MQLITINDASSMAGKSIQTIRRMIKQRKIEIRKQKTPQGFNYLIVKESLTKFLEKNPTILEEAVIQEATIRPNTEGREHRSISTNFEDAFRSQLEQLGTTIQKLIEQSERDKNNFFQLIKTFQDRNGILENRIKQLEAPKLSRWAFWK